MNEFEAFVVRVEPGLRRALTGHLPLDVVPDAMSEAFTYAWQHWADVQALSNPAGYLFRVAQSRSRRRLDGLLPDPGPATLPSFEPLLLEAMRNLPPQQRSAVWLVHACAWTYTEAAEAMGISPSAVGTHISRGLSRLRAQLGVSHDT